MLGSLRAAARREMEVMNKLCGRCVCVRVLLRSEMSFLHLYDIIEEVGPPPENGKPTRGRSRRSSKLQGPLMMCCSGWDANDGIELTTKQKSAKQPVATTRAMQPNTTCRDDDLETSASGTRQLLEHNLRLFLAKGESLGNMSNLCVNWREISKRVITWTGSRSPAAHNTRAGNTRQGRPLVIQAEYINASIFQ